MNKINGSCVAGYSGLVLDSTRSNVMCNCTDDSIYMFNVSGMKTTPGKETNNKQTGRSGACKQTEIKFQTSV